MSTDSFNVKKFLTIIGVIAGILMLSSCSLNINGELPTMPPPIPTPPSSHNQSQTSEPTKTLPPVSQQKDGITILGLSDSLPLPVIAKSKPLGTWNVYSGAPQGFPVGIPYPTNRWIQTGLNDSYPFTNGDGNWSASYSFWATDYEFMNLINNGFSTNSWKCTEQKDDSKRVDVCDKGAYRVILTGTIQPQNGLDPVLDYTIVYYDSIPLSSDQKQPLLRRLHLNNYSDKG